MRKKGRQYIQGVRQKNYLNHEDKPLPVRPTMTSLVSTNLIHYNDISACTATSTAQSCQLSNDAVDTSYQIHQNKKNEKKRQIRTSRLDYCCHNSSINQSEFRGFLNLCNICLVGFLICDPILRYLETGFFIDRHIAKIMFGDIFLLLFFWFQCFCWSFTAYFILWFYTYGYLSRVTVRLTQYTSQIGIIIYSVILCLYHDWSILPCGFALIVTILFCMKIHSFTESLLEFHDLRYRLIKLYGTRLEKLVKKKNQTTYPLTQTTCQSRSIARHEIYLSELQQRRIIETQHNYQDPHLLQHDITHLKKHSSLQMLNENQLNQSVLDQIICDIFLKDLNINPSLKYFVYYLFCPVLVYEPCYPRGHSFRISYFIRKLLEMFAAMGVLYFVSVRYLIPIMYWSAEVSFLVGFLKLIWPMLFCYLLIFFILFECICNLLAEITCFGDRDFYHDWWNSTTWDEFSRKWNRPVHEFLLRHIYYQSVNRYHFSKQRASTATFLVSALLHELLMAVCFKMIRFWMFGLMMLQIPLIAVGQRYQGTDIGNCIFWTGMILGIPLLTIAYGRDYAMQVLSQK